MDRQRAPFPCCRASHPGSQSSLCSGDMLLRLIALHLLTECSSSAASWFVLSSQTPAVRLVEKDTSCATGEFFNLCGECVSGKTEKEEGFGTDSCGVCAGLETCRDQCTDPMADLEGEQTDLTGCLKLVSLSPGILDLAESQEGSICLLGEGISPESLKEVNCILSKGDKEIANVSGEIQDDVVELGFSLPAETGRYQLSCRTGGGPDFTEHLEVVNSAFLRPVALDPTAIVTWTEQQVWLRVGQMGGPGAVLCFCRGPTGEIYRHWSAHLQGNPLSASVLCPQLILLIPGEYDCGIAYSSTAMKTVRTVKLMGVALSPKPVSSSFSPERSRVTITFDQNLDEGNLDSCQSIFKETSLQVFGKGAECVVVANQILVYVGDRSALSKTVLEFKDRVKTKFSDLAVEGSLPVDFQKYQMRPREGPAVVVRGDVRSCSGESAQGDWEAQTLPVNLSAIPPGQRQRLNMISWSLNRSSRASAHLNSTLEKKTEDIQGKAKSSEKVWVHLNGPKELDLASDAVYIAALSTCGVLFPQPDQFVWEVSSQSGDSIDTSLQSGPVLHLEGALLQSDVDYKVTVKVIQGDITLASDEIELRTKLILFQLNLPETYIIVGTGQPIEIDASESSNLDKRLVKFEWFCVKGYCYEPGNGKKPLNELVILAQPTLRLPAKVLAVGRYLFKVEGQSGGMKAKSEVVVEVVAGEPPRFGPLILPELDLGRPELTVRLGVSELRGPCRLSWELVNAIGFAYLSLNQSIMTVRGTPHTPSNQEMTLTLPTSSLPPGAKYKFRCVADCDRFAQSRFEFQIMIPDRFPKFQLLVEPLKGSSLKTNFTYNVLNIKKYENNVEYLFNYGFEENGITKIIYINHERAFTTIFGKGTYKTIVRACRTKLDCITIIGPEISSTVSSNLTEEDIKKLFQTYSELVLSTRFSEAHIHLEMIVPAIKESEVNKYNNFSLEVEIFLMNQIEKLSERLRNDKTTLADCLKLLDAATNALTLLANNDELMSSVLKFRDLIHHTAQLLTETNSEKKVSTNLVIEHRMEKKQFIRSKRKTVKSAKEELENVINSFLNIASSISNITNNTETIAEQKTKLLEYIVFYGTQFCNELENSSTKTAGNMTGLTLIESRMVKLDKQKKKKIQFPQCSKAPCPNITGWARVNLTKEKVLDSFCFTSAYLRDDLLSQVRGKDEHVFRHGPIYWLSWLPYRNGVVSSQIYSGLVPFHSNGSNSSIFNKDQPLNEGSITLQIPLWNGPQPNGTILKCSRFENDGWNLSSCTVKNYTIPGFIICVCPYPGFYSVFGIPENETLLIDRHKSSVASATLTTVEFPIVNSIPKSTTEKSVLTTKPLSATKTAGQLDTLNTHSQDLSIGTDVSGNGTEVIGMKTTPPITPASSNNTVTNPKHLIPTRDPKTIEPTILPITTELLPTTARLPDNVTPSPNQIHHFKYKAYFRINESFFEKVHKNEEKFRNHLENQLKTNLNIAVPLSVEPEGDKIKVTLNIAEKNTPEMSQHLTSLDSLLKNGTMMLLGLNGEVLSVPNQGLHLTDTDTQTSQASTALISVICFLVFLLIGAIAMSIYFRSIGEQRSIRLIQDGYEESAAPKYLRLHDSVSFGSSGPSTPSLVNEMESSLAVLTKTRGRGYESVDNFSNLPGNI